MSPQYFNTPFAANGEKTGIAELTQTDGTVSFQEGYDPDYAKNQEEVGAKFIERDQMNGLFYAITSNLKQWQEQGLYSYNPDIAYGIGGRCCYDDGSGAKAYISTAANNAGVPSIGGKVQNGWQLNDVKAAMEQFGLFGNTNNANAIETVDMNNLTRNGFYNVGNAAANTPNGGFCNVIVIAHSQTNGLQIALTLEGIPDRSDIFCRRFLNGAWGVWQSLGNKGINFNNPIYFPWRTNYTAPVNGTVVLTGAAWGPGDWIQININSVPVAENSAPVANNFLSIHAAVRAGQIIYIDGANITNFTIRFYPD